MAALEVGKAGPDRKKALPVCAGKALRDFTIGADRRDYCLGAAAGAGLGAAGLGAAVEVFTG